MLKGFLHYCLSMAFAADHCESFLCHFLQICADSFCPTLSFPQGGCVHIGKHLVMKVFFTGSGFSVMVPVNGCCRRVYCLQGCYGYLPAMPGLC